MKSQILIDQSVSGWVRPADRTVLREGGSSPLNKWQRDPSIKNIDDENEVVSIIGIKFAINPFKSCMRHRQAFQTDIFCKFDLENDLLIMTFTYNHFENKFNQLRHPENPTIETKIVKNRAMDSRYMPHSPYGWRPSWIWPKRKVKGVENFEPYNCFVI